jgi:hypothetical protein
MGKLLQQNVPYIEVPCELILSFEIPYVCAYEHVIDSAKIMKSMLEYAMLGTNCDLGSSV